MLKTTSSRKSEILTNAIRCEVQRKGWSAFDAALATHYAVLCDSWKREYRAIIAYTATIADITKP